MSRIRTLWWDQEHSTLRFIDQSALPEEEREIACASVARLLLAIRRLEIRGAPVLGVAGAYGVAISAMEHRHLDGREFFEHLERDAEAIAGARPTAVNLSWGVSRVMARVHCATSVSEVPALALEEAEAIAREDGECCERIGDHGAALLPDGARVLTHCNAGALACTRWGTALGVIRSAVRQGKRMHVIACETRPLLQGARLTAWELARDGIPVDVISDAAAAHLMRRGDVDAVIVGADRITRGAVFNKIGTYMHAVCAREHRIPFYVAAPVSTFDPYRDEGDVTIEERPREEISLVHGRKSVPDGAGVINPAFDATPLDLVSAIVTERGILYPPFHLECLHRQNACDHRDLFKA